MKFVMCAVRDAKADMFNRPFYDVSTGAAIRSFGDEVNREAVDNPLYRHPEDFELFQLGTFDDAAADFEIFAKPRSLITAGSCVSGERLFANVPRPVDLRPLVNGGA